MRLYDRGAPEYDDACTLFNAMVERHPRHVARIRDARDGGFRG